MDSEKNVGGRDRLVRGVLAAVLSVVAVRSFRKGKRKTGLLAGIGALGFGFNATTQYCGMNETLGIDTTSDETTDTDSTVGVSSDTDSTVDISTDADDEPTVSANGRKSRASVSLTCAACGDPIHVGEPRGPNDEDEIVHEGCA